MIRRAGGEGWRAGGEVKNPETLTLQGFLAEVARWRAFRLLLISMFARYTGLSSPFFLSQS